jgi:cytochrome c peroxidase
MRHWAIAVLAGSGCADPSSTSDAAMTGGSGDPAASTTSSDGDTSGGASTSPRDLGGGGSSESTGADDLPPEFSDTEWAALLELAPDPLPSPPLDVTNAWADDPDAALLGQALFFTPIFAGRLLDGDQNGTGTSLGNKGDTGKVACASCHVPDDAFSDSRSPSQQISLGAGWGRRRAPSLLDVGHATLLMWDGRHDAMYNQVFGPIESPVEMNTSRLFVAQQVFVGFKAPYEAVFGPMPPLGDTDRFPTIAPEQTGCTPAGNQVPLVCDGVVHGNPGDGAEFDGMSPEDRDAVTRVVVNVGKAIGAYERRLGCGASRFDAWMHGDADALDYAEQRGAKVFIGAGKCVSCHSGPMLSDQQFHNVGLVPAIVASAFIDTDDRGAAVGLASAIDDPLNTHGAFSDGDDLRLPAATSPEHEGAFRTPTLRCVAQRPSFFHTGQGVGLSLVGAFFDDGGGLPGGYPGTSEIAPLGLTVQERGDLVAFLRALDGPGPDASLRYAP